MWISEREWNIVTFKMKPSLKKKKLIFSLPIIFSLAYTDKVHSLSFSFYLTIILIVTDVYDGNGNLQWNRSRLSHDSYRKYSNICLYNAHARWYPVHSFISTFFLVFISSFLFKIKQIADTELDIRPTSCPCLAGDYLSRHTLAEYRLTVDGKRNHLW